MHHTVLVVAEGPDLRADLHRVLPREAYCTLGAGSAAAALDTLASELVDVVVADAGPGGASGLDLLRRVQASHPRAVRLLLAAPGDHEAALAAVGEGLVHRSFAKPCHVVDLAVTIRQALCHAHLLAESRRLLHAVRRQSAVMEELEREVQGLAHGSRDPSGSIALSDVPSDPDRLLQELRTELELTDQRLRAQERELRRRSEQTARRRAAASSA
jgi:DNA-binding NtrC family response regulator